MRWISVSLHRILDFTTVAIFAVAPSALGLTGFAAALSYVLAIVHLAMTLLTRFSPETHKPVSLKWHGAVESIVGVALLSLPWVMSWNGSSRSFYLAAGAAILLVGALSRFRMEAARADA